MSYFYVSNKRFTDFDLAVAYAKQMVSDWARPGFPCVPVVEDKNRLVAVVTHDEYGAYVVHDLRD